VRRTKEESFPKFLRENIFQILFLFLLLLSVLFLKKRYVFDYKFNDGLIKKYLVSQDIEDPERNIKNRTFLSDEEIYFSAGYLYSSGENPAKYNFQHPPLIKYLFGLSIRLFNNPYIVQVIFSLGLIVMVYLFALRVFSNKSVAFLSSFLLVVDPLFIDTSSLGLLDMGQAFFLLVFIYLVSFKKKSFVLQGVFLGLAISSKFWSISLMIFLFVLLFKRFCLREKETVVDILKVLLISGLVYVVVYSRFFVLGGSIIGFIKLQLRILKFMVVHNSSNMLGGNAILFISGFYRDWWKGEWIREFVWTPLWPLGVLSSFVLTIKTFKKKKEIGLFVFSLPLFYFLVTFNQLPFVRYFLLILPFIYISLSLGFLKLFNQV